MEVSDRNKIFNDLVFTDEEINIINSVFQKINAKKGAIILNAGDIADAQYYIVSGCMRTFHTDEEGKEYTLQFGISDWWVSDYTAFFTGDKAILTVEAIQDSTLYRISKEDKEYLFTQIPKIDTFFRIKLEKAYTAFQKRILINLSKTAKQRYLNFIETYPKIEKSIKNYHIASYLGITTESLSRIRKELS
ncbi:Crp/Fnr family transcriptional regulator [Winogradskyella eckloniae]|uniref:Crp/Fnr family transcriptional regulator n=1 Tax=Winogradskyella eckloniae TaxID=1089306 RepID=UPI001567150E|nr:Crp/Fnr family transcriptional regulator [Winogradskyella eckloniae]NRD20621.1 Crp/Fnr family transcriptional regulator [Winogradskyella eckloniae]